MAAMIDGWHLYTVKVVAAAVDPAGRNHTYDLEGLELHNPGSQVYKQGVAPFRRLFPPPVKIVALTVGETGLLELDFTGVFRFHPHTPESPEIQVGCPDGGDGP